MLTTKPQIAIRLTPKQYGQLIMLGNKVASNIDGNLLFGTPAPAVSVLMTAATLVQTNQALWGDMHNRGSHSDLLNLQASGINLHQLLWAEAEYVQNTAQLTAGNDYALMATIIASSGFDLKRAATPQGVLEPVRDLHRFLSPSLNPNQGMLKWTKSANVTSRNNVKSNIVFRSTTPLFESASAIATVSKNEFLDTNTTGAPITYYYWVIAVGAAGYGAVSPALLVTYFA